MKQFFREHPPFVIAVLIILFGAIGVSSLLAAAITTYRVSSAINRSSAPAAAPTPTSDPRNSKSDSETPSKSRNEKSDRKTSASQLQGKTSASLENMTSSSLENKTSGTQEAKGPESGKKKGKGKRGNPGGGDNGPGGHPEGGEKSKVPEALLAAMKEHAIFGKAPREEPQLQAIIGDAALISGNWVELGKEEGPYKLIEIQNSKVTIEWEGEKRELTLWSDLQSGGSGGGGEGPGMSPPPSPGNRPPRSGRGPRGATGQVPPDVQKRMDEMRKTREDAIKNGMSSEAAPSRGKVVITQPGGGTLTIGN